MFFTKKACTIFNKFHRNFNSSHYFISFNKIKPKMFDLNVNFLEKIIRKYEADDSILITNLHKSPACEKGENFMSVVRRVRIEGKRNENNNLVDYRNSVIIKRPYTSEVMQLAFNSTEIFLNEVIAFNEIIPALKENSKIPLPVVECIYADHEMIVLKDLNSEGYEMRRNEASMSIEQCLAVIQELAVFHSASIILKHRQPDKVKNFSKRMLEIYRPNNKSIIDLLDKNISVALTLLKNSEKDNIMNTTIQKLEYSRDKIYNRVCDLFKNKRDTDVFNHGDCWRNNILFKANGNIDVKLIDLQIMRYTSIAADLNYFLYINLIPKDRNDNIDLFLDTYLNKLHESIEQHNLNINLKKYNKEWLEKEMQKFSVFGFMCSLWISPAFYYDKTSLPDMNNITSQELDADYHKKFILQHMTPGLKDRIISLVIDFVNNYKF